MTHLPVLLNPDLTEVKRLSPVSLNLKLNMTPLSTASMTLSEGEEIPSRSFVEIFTAKGSAGVFRAREPETSYGETQTSIELEHAITEVGDSLITESIEEELPLDEAMATLFEYYKGDAWQMDEIDFTDTVVVDVDYANVLEAIISVLQQVPSYYMTFDFSTSPWTFGLAQVDSQVTAEGRLSRNVSSGSFKNDDSSLTTRAYALYKDGDDEILIHEDSDWGLQHFGLVERKLSDTYESEEEARAAAQKYLEQNNRPRFSISINGTELSDMTGETLDEFEIGKRFRFVFDATIEPVDEIIKSVEYTDLVTDEHNVIVSMNEEEELDYVLDGTKQNAKNNRATSKNLKNLNDEIHKELYDEDGYFNSRLDFTASHLRLEFTDNLNSMRGELEMTASHLRTVFDDELNSLHGEFEVSASHLRTEFTDAQNSLRGEFEVSASHLRTEFTDGQNSLRSEFEITASHLRTEFSNSINSMRTVVEQTDSGWRTALEGVVDANGKVTAASIATKINAQGQAGVKISGAWVNIDGSTTINDVLSISDNGVNISKKIRVSGDVMAETITLRHGQNSSSLTEADFERIIVKAQVSGNTLYLWKNGDDVSDTSGASINFSKATTLTGAWDSGTYTVTASPQGNDRSTTLQIITPVPNSTITRSGKSVSRQFKVQYGPNENSLSDTGFTQTITIDASSVYDYGKGDSTVTAGTSAITWDSTNKKFYNYGYAYLNGSSQPNATSSKRESSTISLDTSASWSNGSKSIVVKHGSTNILSDTVSIPAVSDTTWENTSGNYWRTRLTIGGVYRYSSTKEFATAGYTQAQYDQNFLDGYNYDPHDLGIYDVNSAQKTSAYVSAGGSLELWPGFPKYQASGYVWGTKVTVYGSYPSNHCILKYMSEYTTESNGTYTYWFRYQNRTGSPPFTGDKTVYWD